VSYKKTGLVLVSLIVSIVSCEFVYRYIEVLTDRNIEVQLLRYNNCFKKDKDTVFKLKENCSGYSVTDEYQYHTYINSQGFRVSDIDKGYRATIGDRKRILFVGDSFTFGTGVEYRETFSDISGELLGKSYQIINAGVPGWRVGNYHEFYKKYGRNLNPDLVVINICILNDIFPGKEYRAVTDDGYLGSGYKVKYDIGAIHKLHVFMYRKFSLYRLFSRNNMDLSRFMGERTTTPVKPTDFFMNILAVQYYASSAGRKRYAGFFKTMDKFVSTLRNDKVKFMFVFVPYQQQTVASKFLKAPKKKNLQYRINEPQEHINRYCIRKGIKCFDPFASFLDAGNKGKKVFFDIDGHFNVLGNKIMAKEITGAIRDKFSF